MVNRLLKYFLASFSMALIILATSFSFSLAEQSGTSAESGTTSYIKTLYNSLVSLSYGSDSAGAWGNWGAYWNRIRSAGEWVPSSAATASDVRAGKKFYSNSRSQQTGTYPAVSGCSTQAYYAGNASATKANNCGLDWVVASPAVTGDDKQDPRTGLVWSQALKNNAGTVQFVTSGSSAWTWDGTTTFTITSASATAGAIYTNNGHNFTVNATITSATSLNTTPDGLPSASGTLTLSSGTGAATITFSAVNTNNYAVGSKTASQLCSERGDGWRLPTQRELMQAYVDGGYWNLTTVSSTNLFWSATEATVATSAYYGRLDTGTSTTAAKTAVVEYVRCVR